MAAAKKAIIAVYPSDTEMLSEGIDWSWTFGINGRPYAESPVVYSRKGDARGSAQRFAKMLAIEATVVVTPVSPFAH